MATGFVEFRRYVEPHATGATPFDILFNAREVLRDWCLRSKCWQVILTPFATTPDVASYALTVPSGTVVAQVEEVYRKDHRIEFSGMDWLSHMRDRNWMAKEAGSPIKTYALDPGVPSLFQVPNDAGLLYFRVALQPDNTAELVGQTFPDFIFQRWASQIADGILAKLYGSPDKPYSSSNKSDAKTIRYEQHVAKAKLEIARSFGRKELETVPRFY